MQQTYPNTNKSLTGRGTVLVMKTKTLLLIGAIAYVVWKKTKPRPHTTMPTPAAIGLADTENTNTGPETVREVKQTVKNPQPGDKPNDWFWERLPPN